MVIHRPHSYGGLGLHSVKYKALAGYITTFLQTASNPSFCPNLLHSLLYRKYILEEEVPCAPDPPPPYFSKEFFSIIKNVKNDSPLNIIAMREKDWVRYLTEEYITMTSEPSGQRHYTPCKAELAVPNTDWSLCWAACRQPGVPPDLASFLWRLLHNLLSTQEKLHRMGTIRSPICKMQGCSDVGSVEHELLHCTKNDGVGLKLLACLQQYVPGLEAAAALRLDHGAVEEKLSLPLTLLTAIVLNTLWKEREAGTVVKSYKVRAELEQYINLLRTSRLNNTVTLLDEMSQTMFH